MKKIANFLKSKFQNSDSDSSTKNQQNNNRWDFLDGYRGSLALIIVIIHSKIHENCEIINMTLGYSQSYSIAGFFMLSAFLLTYRLLKDFTKANKDPKQYLLYTLKYFIRRFFRIYLYYVGFFTVAKYGPAWIGASGRLSHYDVPISQIILLGNAGRNHLWTIPPEIKYYAFIPVYCMVACLLGQHTHLLSALSLLWTLFDLILNFFNLTTDDSSIHHANTHHLKSHFSVFFLGSQVALGYFLIEQNEPLLRRLNTTKMQNALNKISLLIAFIGLRVNLFGYYYSFAFKTIATLFWSICLLLTLLSRPNTISNFFANNEFLKTLGRHSYSLYLLHVGVVSLMARIGFQYQCEHVLYCIVVCYYVGYFFYELIEYPLIRFANDLCSKLESLPFFSDNHKPVV